MKISKSQTKYFLSVLLKNFAVRKPTVQSKFHNAPHLATVTTTNLRFNVSPLLSIPRELRDLILDLVILTLRPIPQSLSHRERERRVEAHDFAHDKWRGEYGVRYDPDEPRTARPLLFVNKQLRAETLAAMHRAPNDFILDLLLVDEMVDFWATWRLVPRLTTAVNTLRVDVRQGNLILIGTEKIRQLWQRRDVPLPTTHEMFIAILARFFQLGPVSPRSRVCCYDMFLSTQVLEFNFSSTSVSFQTGIRKYDERIDKEKARLLLDGLREHIEWRLRDDYFGETIYKRVGIIRYLLDGELQSTDNLGTKLFTTTESDSSFYLTRVQEEFSTAQWERWRRNAYPERVRLGLPVPREETLRPKVSSALDDTLEDIAEQSNNIAGTRMESQA